MSAIFSLKLTPMTDKRAHRSRRPMGHALGIGSDREARPGELPLILSSDSISSCVSQTKNQFNGDVWLGFERLTCVPIQTKMVKDVMLSKEERQWLKV